MAEQMKYRSQNADKEFSMLEREAFPLQTWYDSLVKLPGMSFSHTVGGLEDLTLTCILSRSV